MSGEGVLGVTRARNAGAKPVVRSDGSVLQSKRGVRQKRKLEVRRYVRL